MANKFQIKCLKSEILSSVEHFAQFSIGPLDTGQGVTLGNTLRRILLSELKSTAITSVRISGIQHEFSVLDGVREDILEILLNLKEIIFQGLVENLSHAFLKVKGPYVITARDLQLPNDLKVINPTQYIATISESTSLEMELGIESGKGYNLVENHISSNFIDALEIDAIFMPVRKVNFEVKTLILPEDQIREHLILDITTNGSITPRESIVKASKQIITLFSPLTDPEFINSQEPEQALNFDLIKLEDLNFSVRTYNCLKRAQIDTLLDLVKYPPDKLRNLKNLGDKSFNEIYELLKNKFSITLNIKL